MSIGDMPWLSFYGTVPHKLSYPDCSMAELVRRTAEKDLGAPAYEFFGKRVSYETFLRQIETCAAALQALGVGRGDRVTICMPNCPQGIIFLYGANLIGAVAAMVHPLSAQEEIAAYIRQSGSKIALTLDQFYPKFAAVSGKLSLNRLVVASVADAMSPAVAVGYRLTKGRKMPKIPQSDTVLLWNEFMALGEDGAAGKELHGTGAADAALILYSGGTTGSAKGVLLSNQNLNALALQTIAAGNCTAPRQIMLSIMPIFHGFGLGVCIHTALVLGGCCVLVPQFTVQSCIKLLRKYRPNYIVGVPTLFEAITRASGTEKLDLSPLKGVFCGGDSLSPALKEKIDTFLRSHGAKEQVREGYGMTECVAVSCLTPRTYYRSGSIGIPVPDMRYKIVQPATQEELPKGEMGEICISGPTVMMGYLNNPEETARALQLHEDGRLWLHTGDLGKMDEDGFVYFCQRLKRMIISSGYNVYPAQIEEVLNRFPGVLMSTVIGVRDDYKMQRVKAFIVPEPGQKVTQEFEARLWDYCRKNIAKYAMPKEIEFRQELPKTLLGKIAYGRLEKEIRN